MKKYIKILIVLSILIAGCGAVTAPEIEPVPIIEEPAQPTQAPVIPPAEDDMLQELIAQAQADLADRLGIIADEITLLESKPVNWSDSSLGCPEPGMMYMQVITPGYLIRFDVGGQVYEYHAGKSAGSAIYCDDPQPPTAGEPLDH